MSTNWVTDINKMHTKYGVHEWVKTAPQEHLKEFLKFRLDFINEELQESLKAFDEKDPEEIVDGLLDICVVAIGTLDAFKIDGHKGWDKILEANMAKEVGVKEGRPNPLGLPDLIKPEGWQAPSHEGNHGLLVEIFE